MTTNGHRPPSETPDADKDILESGESFSKTVSLQEYQESWKDIIKKFPSGELNATAKIAFNALGNLFYKEGRDTVDLAILARTMAPKLKDLRSKGTHLKEVLQYMWELGLWGGVEAHA